MGQLVTHNNRLNAAPRITVHRLPYEEPYHTQLEIEASNGVFAGAIDLYCAVDDIRDVGRALSAFPSRVPDEYRFTYGSDDPARRFYRLFVLRAYTTDSVGHCALQVIMDRNTEEPDEGRCCFSIGAEPAQIGRLGRLFMRLHEKPSTWFRWALVDDEFVDRRKRGGV